jgi:hypothetical protein
MEQFNDQANDKMDQTASQAKEQTGKLSQQADRMREKGQQFFEAMPATMNQMGRTVSDKMQDRSFMRKTLPWLIIPAAALIVRAVWGNSKNSDGEN